jgi:diadenosine tetraphosphate (Ap4A) HIT family hydrolase
MKDAYRCDGVSTRQHNEPAGDQDVWHLHVHVLPRHQGDQLYLRHLDGAYGARRGPGAVRGTVAAIAPPPDSLTGHTCTLHATRDGGVQPVGVGHEVQVFSALRIR